MRVVHRGQILGQLDRIQEADREFTRALQLDPKFEPARTARRDLVRRQLGTFLKSDVGPGGN
jgi:hypothetical protein